MILCQNAFLSEVDRDISISTINIDISNLNADICI